VARLNHALALPHLPYQTTHYLTAPDPTRPQPYHTWPYRK